MKYVLILLKQKFFYVIIAVAYVIYSVMTYNREHNEDKLAAYYGTSAEAKEEVPPESGAIDKVNLQGQADEINAIIAFAEEQLGKPYGFARKGPDAFDCSGLTGFVFKRFDYRLSASSNLQAQQGVHVPQKELRPGDLVFFITPTARNNDIDHVGIVISVNQGSIKFIHSSTSKGVVIDDLIQSEYYSSCYVGARRMIDGS